MGYKEYYKQLNVKKLEDWDKTGIQLKTFFVAFKCVLCLTKCQNNAQLTYFHKKEDIVFFKLI